MDAKTRYKLCAHALGHYWNEVLVPAIGPESNEGDREELNNYYAAYKRMAELSGEEISNPPRKFNKGEWKEYIKLTS